MSPCSPSPRTTWTRCAHGCAPPATRRAGRGPEYTGWQAGTEVGELRRLVEYWADGSSTPVHYLRFDGECPDAVPIVLTHGWPSTFLELVGLARRLAQPSQHGVVAVDAFTVIVPSLPGYPFSSQRPALPPDLDLR